MFHDLELLEELLEIYTPKMLANHLSRISESDWTSNDLKAWKSGKQIHTFSISEAARIKKELLPSLPNSNSWFKFADLFAGIGGIRRAFDGIGGECVFTSEIDTHAVKTYKANYSNTAGHVFNEDIREITLTDRPETSEEVAYSNISKEIPDHDVLLAGFPCQPFSLAGVSKKNAIGQSHGFECKAQGTLFFDVARIIAVQKPKFFVLENVKNLKGHDGGNTFKVIKESLLELGYWISDLGTEGPPDPKIIDAQHFLPQHRERIVLVGFRNDLGLQKGFTLNKLQELFPLKVPTFKELLDNNPDEKYTLSEHLWEYLYNYAKKHRARGNGFGYGLVDPEDENAIARTLSARYHKDGAEILIDRGWDRELGENKFRDVRNLSKRPRRLSPRECARLMGFDGPGESNFRIPVSDTQAYRQFGNSVVVPVFRAIAELLEPYIRSAVSEPEHSKQDLNEPEIAAAATKSPSRTLPF